MPRLGLPQIPQNIGPTFLWFCIIITFVSLVVGGSNWCWNNIMPKLFHLPFLTLYNSMALVGIILFVFGSLWGMFWLVYASVREVK